MSSWALPRRPYAIDAAYSRAVLRHSDAGPLSIAEPVVTDVRPFTGPLAGAYSRAIVAANPNAIDFGRFGQHAADTPADSGADGYLPVPDMHRRQVQRHPRGGVHELQRGHLQLCRRGVLHQLPRGEGEL